MKEQQKKADDKYNEELRRISTPIEQIQNEIQIRRNDLQNICCEISTMTVVEDYKDDISTLEDICQNESLKEYVITHFNIESKMQAIKYCKAQTGASLKDVKTFVEELLG